MENLREVWEYLEHINTASVIFRMIMATLLGGMIGMDRGRHGRVAGTRTHILVCLGAAVTTLVGFYTAEHLGYVNDPLRMGAQVISGVGFLGVGTIIIRNQSQVKGLTTAAGLWTTACIGLAVGAGFYLVALLAFLMVILTVSVLVRLEGYLRGRDAPVYYVEVEGIARARAFYDELAPMIDSMELVPAKSGLAGYVGMEVFIEDVKTRKAVYERLQKDKNVAIVLPEHN